MAEEVQLPRRSATGSDKEDYKERQAAECGIDRLKRNRVVATRYGKPAVRYEAIVPVAAINERLRPARP